MSSGSIPADIQSIVDDLKQITWEQVLFEAITNSLQANAREININFLHDTLDIEDTKKSIEKITVEDDGDGFTEKNTESFQKYRSAHKRHLGAKGTGRFLYLKIFKEIYIESLNKKIEFMIDRDIKVSEVDKFLDKTILFLNRPKKNFRVDFESFEQKIRDHFIAYFKLLNDEVKIRVYENDIEKFQISSKEIPIFKTKVFNIHHHEFILSYVFESQYIKEYDGFYCAGERVVIKNSNLDFKKKLKNFYGMNIIYLLSSKYLDTNVNETRDNFIMNPSRTSAGLYSDLAWKDIHDELANQFKIIAKENDINIEDISKKRLEESRKIAPYLSYYLRDNENAFTSEVLLKQAKSRLEADKKLLREKNEKIDNYQHLLGIVTQSELAEYIFDRQKKIDFLKKLTNDDKTLEKEIHNLFMKQNTIDTVEDYQSNNLWLFDDRFMTYDKVFSEAQIKSIFPELIENVKRPDILSLSVVSNTYNKEDITDIVIIELKRADERIDPSGAETQLLRYSRYINDNRKNAKIRIWTYAFLKFNEETEFDLDNRSYNKIPIQGEYPIYYRYYEKPNTIINFLDYRSMAIDANNRNKTFMKILSGQTI